MRRAMICMAIIWAVSGAAAYGDDGVTPAGHRRPLVAPLYGGSAPCCPPAPYTPGMPGTPGTPTPSTEPGEPNPIEQAMQSPFAQAAEAGGLAANSFNESFDGDFGGVFYARSVVTGYQDITTTVGFQNVQTGTTTTFDAQGRAIQTPVFTRQPINVTERVPKYSIIRAPLGGRYNGVQIVDNDNPRPVDRFYFTYNYYSDVGASLNAPTVGGSDIQRQMMGFEKTLLNGDASIGMRLPFIQQYGPGVFGAQDVGDLSVLFKYAFINNRETGNVASVGLVITAPTGGGSAILIDGLEAPNSTLFQPWAGFVRIFGERTYVQGISNIIVPSDGRDPTLWGNSLGVGYWLYRNPTDRMIQGFIPHAEVHVRTPLNHRDELAPVFLMDQVNLTSGVHLRCARATITGAVCVPIVGPIPWTIEAMGYVNYRF